jgi:anti-sigma regulatory factor (Ser/Thr protein kinase)
MLASGSVPEHDQRRLYSTVCSWMRVRRGDRSGVLAFTMMTAVERALNESYPAVADSVPRARGAVIKLARAAGASPDNVDSIRLAVSEALSNAVLHAYPDRSGEICVTAAVVGQEFWVLISDHGGGLGTSSVRGGLGLGLALIAQEADDFTIVPRATRGVEVRMRFELQSSPQDPGRGRGRSRRCGSSGQSRGSVSSASSPASPNFSTMM